jgi:DNA-binding transcriptional regulator YiaG
VLPLPPTRPIISLKKNTCFAFFAEWATLEEYPVALEVALNMARVLTQRELNAIRKLAERLEKKGLAAEGRKLRSIISPDRERIELKASEAAAILRVTPQTVRNWVRSGLLSGRVDRTGHILVQVAALRPAIDMEAAMPYRSRSEGKITDDEILEEIAAHRSERRRR